jgi:hypothetical protein
MRALQAIGYWPEDFTINQLVDGCRQMEGWLEFQAHANMGEREPGEFINYPC